jgi:hypothetical protein
MHDVGLFQIVGAHLFEMWAVHALGNTGGERICQLLHMASNSMLALYAAKHSAETLSK